MKFYIVLILTGFLFSCSSSPFKAKKDLVGVWGNSDDGGQTFWGYDEYLPNGKLIAWGTFPDSFSSYYMEANYEIKDADKLESCLTVTKTSEPELMPIGLSWCDEVVEVNSNTFKFRDEYGEITTLYKQKQHITRPSI